MDLSTAQLALEAADVRYKAAWAAREDAKVVFRASPLTAESRAAYGVAQDAFKRALSDWEDAAAAVQAAHEAEPFADEDDGDDAQMELGV